LNAEFNDILAKLYRHFIVDVNKENDDEKGGIAVSVHSTILHLSYDLDAIAKTYETAKQRIKVIE